MAFKLTALLLACCALLAGCDRAPPACNDPATLATVKDIIRQQLIPEVLRPSQQAFDRVVKLELGAPVKYDETIRRFDCQATLKIDGSQGLTEEDKVKVGWMVMSRQAPDLLELLGQRDSSTGELRQQVTYSSQQVDKQHIVKVSEFPAALGAAAGAYARGADGAQGGAQAAAPGAVPAAPPSGLPVASWVDKYPFDLLQDPKLRPRLQALTGTAFQAFEERLGTAGPARMEGDELVAQGLQPHMGGSEEAIFTVNARTGAVAAGLMENEKNLRWFGATSVADMPAPIRRWLAERGAK